VIHRGTIHGFSDELQKIAEDRKRKGWKSLNRGLGIVGASALGAGAGYGLGTLAYHGLRKSPRVKKLFAAPAAKRLRYLKPAAAVTGLLAAAAIADKARAKEKVLRD